jgi:hypothetical protein
MFIDPKALRDCAREGAIPVQLCTLTETSPDYALGIEPSSSYNCTPVEGYAYVDKYSLIATAGSDPSLSAWHVCLFPPIPEIEPSSRFLIKGKYFQIEEVQPMHHRGQLITVKYRCLKK